MGIFKCGEHSYETDDLDEFDLHMANEVHTHKGIAPCNMCGVSTPFSFTGKKGKKAPALCQQCKDIALGGLN